jgi:hypothetical protein
MLNVPLTLIKIPDLFRNGHEIMRFSISNILKTINPQSENTQEMLYSRDSGFNCKCLTVRGHGYGAVAGGAQYAASLLLVPS